MAILLQLPTCSGRPFRGLQSNNRSRHVRDERGEGHRSCRFVMLSNRTRHRRTDEVTPDTACCPAYTHRPPACGPAGETGRTSGGVRARRRWTVSHLWRRLLWQIPATRDRSKMHEMGVDNPARGVGQTSKLPPLNRPKRAGGTRRCPRGFDQPPKKPQPAVDQKKRFGG